MSHLVSDFRYALRQLRKSPGFTLTSVLTLALGIGATTAIFTLVHAVLLKSLPVARPAELYRFGDKSHCCQWGGYTQREEYSIFSGELYRYFRDHTPAFTNLAAFQAGSSGLAVRRTGSPAQAETRNGQFVSGNFFQTFGVSAWVGRTFTDADDRQSMPLVAVMSYSAWQQKYGADPSVIGAAFQINGKPFTIIGVAAPGFYGADLRAWAMPDFWMPLSDEIVVDGALSRLNTANSNWLDIIGRVRPGTDPKALESQLRLELRQWQESHAADLASDERQMIPRQQFHLTPGGAGISDMREQYESSLRMLLVAASCVLLIACANLANLLLGRGLRNRQQTSVRIALGASRGRLIAKALVESVTLGLVGGFAGLAVAYGGTSLILKLAFSGPHSAAPIDASPSLPVLLFALAVSLVTGILFGIAPAWITSHAEPVEALRGANRTVGGTARWPQRILVILQAAVSLVLLCAAAMLSRSLGNLQQQNFGFDIQGHYLATINPLQAGYQTGELDALYRRVEQRLRRIPGVTAVASATYAPMSGDSWNDSIRVQGKPEPGFQDDDNASWTRVTPGFFAALGNRIDKGRAIGEQDTATSPRVAVINEAFARKFFPGENPIGKHFGMDEVAHAGDFEVVGIAADMRYLTYNLRETARPMVFLPASQHVVFGKTNLDTGERMSHYLSNMILATSGTPANLEEQVRRALGDVDPNLPLIDFASYSTQIANDFGQQNLIAKLTLLFGALALILAAVGLYGVTSYAVEQRTNEIGIRMALGANRASVLSMILRSAFLQVAVGLFIGIPAAIVAGHAIADQLYGVRPWDPAMLASATFTLALAALVAAIVPAQRAASLNPTQALRRD